MRSLRQYVGRSPAPKGSIFDEPNIIVRKTEGDFDLFSNEFNKIISPFFTTPSLALLLRIGPSLFLKFFGCLFACERKKFDLRVKNCCVLLHVYYK